MAKSPAPEKASELSVSAEITARLAEIGGWRGEMLARLRALILKADPDITETVKWRKPTNNMRGVPVWEHGVEIQRDGVGEWTPLWEAPQWSSLAKPK